MSIRPEILQPAPSDAGSAMSIADLTRRLAILEGQYGVFGDNMRVTGATVETSDPSNVASGRVYLDGVVDPPGLFVEDSSGHTVIQLTGGASPGVAAYDDSGNASFVLQGGSNPVFYQNDPTFGPTVWIIPIGGLGLLAGISGGNSVSWHQNLLAPMDSFVQGYRWSANVNAWHAHAFSPSGSAGTDLTLYADNFGSQNIMELWTGPSTNTKVLWITSGGAGTIIGDWNVKGTCYITGGMSAIANSICWNDLTVFGVCTVGALVVSSDESLKADLQDVPKGRILEDLKVVRYTHKTTGRQHYGLIAQEVANHVPEIVTAQESPVAPEEAEKQVALGIDLYSLVSLMLVELQRLTQKVIALEE